jgi:hypothetical protein
MTLCALLAKALGLDETLSVKQCRLSVVDATGETDLYAVFLHNSRQGILLIENKIDAGFQPFQPERYKQRANLLAKENGYDYVFCLLIAPARYIDRTNEQFANFDAIVCYEDLAGAIAADLTPRSKHRSALMLRAVEQAHSSYILAPVAEVGSFWRRVHAIASTEFPDLEMLAPSDKGRQSKWIIFKADLPPRITIDWKITSATVELSFWHGAIQQSIKSLPFPSLPVGSILSQKGTTEMIRIPLSTPPTDWIAMADNQIREALSASRRLLQFFRTNRALLLSSTGD